MATLSSLAERSGLALIEEAFQVLRANGLRTLFFYYAGALPFATAFLYFWTDLVHDPDPDALVIGGALLVAVSYLWMKCWQSVFLVQTRRSFAAASARSGPFWTPSRVLHLIGLQCAMQPSSLLAIPCAAAAVLPLHAVYGFYQTLLAAPYLDPQPLGQTLSAAWTTSARWPRQAWAAFLLLTLFSLVVLLNVTALMAAAPQLIKMLTGFDSEFTRSAGGYVNSTFFQIGFMITYLIIDPILKTAFLLRAYYAQSITTGQDLKDTFHLRVLTVARVLVLCLALPLCLRAQDPQPPAANAIPAAQLDDAIKQTAQRRIYAWRKPHQPPVNVGEGPVTKMTRQFFAWVQRQGRTAQSWAKDFINWLRRALRREQPKPKPGDIRNQPESLELEALLILFALLLLGALVYLLFFTRKRTTVAAPVEAVAATPVDLAADDLVADQLPDDEWMILARQALHIGDLRGALRALYLASLASLGEHGLLRIHRAKTNLEYRRELERRARLRTELLGDFALHVDTFERTWYGRSPASPQELDEFLRRTERIRAHAG